MRNKEKENVVGNVAVDEFIDVPGWIGFWIVGQVSNGEGEKTENVTGFQLIAPGELSGDNEVLELIKSVCWGSATQPPVVLDIAVSATWQ